MAGRSVIVTGGFGALGRVISKHFSDGGDRVARVDFSSEAPDKTANGLDFAGVDLTDSIAVDKVVADIVEAQDGIDILVNIAGGFIWETLADGDIDNWTRMFSTNLRSNATITKAALAAIRRSPQGRIINIGAGAAIHADAGMGAYAASKAGVHRLTEALAAELADSRITVNAVLPTIIDTPANREAMPDADNSNWIQPQAIAEVIHFLASPAARSISGALIPISRGQLT
jgi:NAD(P)-dependent dehydrogenase (short-subunit alcohol dehydrogenase family)